MDNLLEFKLIYKLISEEKYEIALLHLKNFGLENNVNTDGNFHYLNALINIKLGNITLARKHLTYIKQQSHKSQVNILEKKLKELEPLYILLVTKYNKAIDLLKEKDYFNAHEVLEEIFSQSNSFSFPIQWYKTFYTLKLQIQAGDTEKWVTKLPAYIKKNQEIEKMMSLSNMATSKTKNSTLIKKKKVSPWVAYGVGSIAILLSIVLSLNFYLASEVKQSSDEIETQSVTFESNNESIIEKTIVVPEDSLDEKKIVIEEFYPELTSLTAEAFYKEGYQQYQAGNFEDAILNLKLVKESAEKTYFTDDAHYYLLLSLNEEGRYADSINESQSFINEQDNNYKLSPYLEAVHLNTATALIKSGEISEASAVLEKLIGNNQKGWVFSQAQSMLGEISDDN